MMNINKQDKMQTQQQKYVAVAFLLLYVVLSFAVLMNVAVYRLKNDES